MKIRMLRSKLGSNDGATTQMYEKDEAYEVSDELGEIFLRDKDAEVDDKAAKPEAKAPAAKAEAKAPENKAIAAAPENKAS